MFLMNNRFSTLVFRRCRSSRREVFCKKVVLRNFAKFTGKHLCQSLFFSKFAGLSPATLLKKRPRHSWFPVNFTKFLRTPFLTEHLRWLLLIMFCIRPVLNMIWLIPWKHTNQYSRGSNLCIFSPSPYFPFSVFSFSIIDIKCVGSFVTKVFLH